MGLRWEMFKARLRLGSAEVERLEGVMKDLLQQVQQLDSQLESELEPAAENALLLTRLRLLKSILSICQQLRIRKCTETTKEQIEAHHEKQRLAHQRHTLNKLREVDRQIEKEDDSEAEDALLQTRLELLQKMLSNVRQLRGREAIRKIRERQRRVH